MPTGGVTAENLGEYLALPSVAACGGTWICTDSDAIEQRAREAAAA
jgi:2-dehydro-3-deoxyphosphogluconate aldolase/(4S)-4-hydroxy-2-oxoglutarate aldolase